MPKLQKAKKIDLSQLFLYFQWLWTAAHEWFIQEMKPTWELVREVLYIFSSPEWAVWRNKRQRKNGRLSKRLLKLRRSEAMIIMDIAEWEGLEEMVYERTIIYEIAESIYKQKLDIVDRDDMLNENEGFNLEEFVKNNKDKFNQ